jgi:hypothetical protein
MGDRSRGGSCPQQAKKGMGIEVKGPNPVQGGSEIERRRWEEGDFEAKGEKAKRGKGEGKGGVGFIKNQGWRGPRCYGDDNLLGIGVSGLLLQEEVLCRHVCVEIEREREHKSI